MNRSEKHTDTDYQSDREEFISLVFTRMREGNTRSEITEDFLSNRYKSANPLLVAQEVKKTYNEVALASIQEQFLMGSYLPSIVGGLLAAIIMGCLWGLIIKYTDLELGIIAIAVGWLCGWSVLFFMICSKVI